MKDDFSALENMVYSGRGIIVGMTPNGNPFVGYSLTGRSSSSQARKLVEGDKKGKIKTGTIRTDVTDKEQLEKGSPALLLYPAIVPVLAENNSIIASNGAQTKLIYSELMRHDGADQKPSSVIRHAFDRSFFEYDQHEDRWIDITTYEPDAPNNTPRISSCVINNIVAMNIVKKGDLGQSEIEYINLLKPGKGKLITTYKGGNEEPLLPFEGEPLDVRIESEFPEEIVENIYEAIKGGQDPGDNYRVAAAVVLCNRRTELFESKRINRSERGE